MDPAGSIALVAATLQLTVAFVSAALAIGPGWTRAWYVAAFGVVAFAYSGITLLNRLVSIEVGRMLDGSSSFLACLGASIWLEFALGKKTRALSVASAAIGAVCLWPGVVTNGTTFVDVPWLGMRYSVGHPTRFGSFVSVWIIAQFALCLAVFARAAWRRERGSLLRVIGFSLFFLFSALEVLVYLGYLSMPFTADFGLLAIAVSGLTIDIRKVIQDARDLQRLRDELSATVIDRTQERDQAREALEDAGRHAALGQLAAAVGHEINNPLTYMRLNAQLLHEELIDGKLHQGSVEMAAEILDGVGRVAHIVAELRRFATAPMSGGVAPFEVAAAVEAALSIVSPQVRQLAIVRSSVAPGSVVLGYESKLTQVLVNLVMNAAHALEDATAAKPLIDLLVVVREGKVLIEVQDNGAGMTPELMQSLGDPYFTTRSSRGGTGLGVFVSREIVEAMGGSLTYESKLGKGTTARVTLPLFADKMPEPIVRVEEAPIDRSGVVERRAVLVVDDEVTVARSIARRLKGHEVMVATSCSQAAQILRSNVRIDVVICDVLMPGESGLDVFESVKAARPALSHSFAFMTGGIFTQSIEERIRATQLPCFAKPIEPGLLETFIAEVSR